MSTMMISKYSEGDSFLWTTFSLLGTSSKAGKIKHFPNFPSFPYLAALRDWLK